MTTISISIFGYFLYQVVSINAYPLFKELIQKGTLFPIQQSNFREFITFLIKIRNKKLAMLIKFGSMMKIKWKKKLIHQAIDMKEAKVKGKMKNRKIKVSDFISIKQRQ